MTSNGSPIDSDEKPSLNPEVTSEPDAQRFEEVLRDRLTWLFVFRAVALALTLVLSVGVRVGSNAPLLNADLAPVSAVVLAGFVSILAGAFWIRIRKTEHIFALAVVQVALDGITTTALIWFTGGVSSGFVFLYSLAVLGAAAILGRRGSFSAATLVGLMYSGMVVLEAFGIHASPTSPSDFRTILPTFFVNVLAFFLVAFLAGFLSDQLSRTSQQLVQAQEQVVALEELAEAILESLPSGVLTVDGDERLLFINRAGGELLGEERDQLVGRPSGDVLPGLPDGPRPEQARLNFELELDAGDSIRHFAGTAASLKGLEGRTGRVVIFDDQTELLRLQQEASRHQELATVGRFAAGMAHEIRNPLAAMLGCLNLLEKDVEQAALGDDTVRMVSIVQAEAERLSDLVSAFLEYARPAPPKRENINLASLVQETVQTILSADDLDQNVDVTIDVWAAPTVRCDPAHFRQVMWNIIRNAISAASGEMSANEAAAPAEKKVRLTVDATDRMGLVVIEDSGPGIPKESQVRIFEPFFTTRRGGTGLGLAESHQLILAQGGRLEVGNSDDLGGARFEIVVPFVEFAEVSRELPAAEGREETVHHPNYRAKSSPSNAPVVVDDREG